LATGFYYDLLGRAPSPGEVAGWASAFQAGLNPGQAALAIASTTEYLSTLATNDYWSDLGRGPTPAEVSSWVQALQAGLTEQQMSVAFLASTEFYQDQGNNNTSWLTSLYQHVLNRTPSGGELAAWNQVMQNGLSRVTVAMGFENSTEVHTMQVGYAYQHLLGRSPDAAGLAGWAAAMDQGLTRSMMIATIASTPEYTAAQTLTPETPAPFNTGSNPGVHFEFASENSAVAAGFTKVPVVNYTPTRGYGWLTISGLGWRDWNTANPLTSSYELGPDATFRADVPNGTYKVTVTVGDAEQLHDNMSLWVNGTPLASGLTTAVGQFSQSSANVQVTNGQVAVRIAGSGPINSSFAIDALDIAPVNTGSLTVSPGTLSSATANSAYSATVSASGGSGSYSFAVTSGSLPGWLSLNGSTGVLSGTPTTTGTSTFTVTATDSNTGATGSQAYTLKVNAASSLTVSPASLSSATANGAYSATVSASGGSGTYSFAVTSGSLPSWLTLNGSTGVLSGTPSFTGTATFTITATDSGISGLTGSQAYTLKVNPASSLTVTPPTLANATANTAYTVTLGATGGSGAATFAVTSGSLPAWLSLNSSTGVLSGTPTTTGKATFTITATDKNISGLMGSLGYTLTVNPASSLTVSPAGLTDATANSAYSATLSATGGSGTYTFAVTSGSLPSWLTLNSSTGVLSGTPTITGNATFTITASDSNISGLKGSQAYALTVDHASSLTLTPSALVSPTVNTPYKATLGATGGSGTATYAVTSGSLPSWLTLNTATGVLSGTPTAIGTSSFTITATDTSFAGLTGRQAYTFTVTLLVHQSNLQYVGAFRVPGIPDPNVSGDWTYDYGGTALAFNPANNSLFLDGIVFDQAISEISIPQSIVNSTNLNDLSVATVLQPPREVLGSLPNNPNTSLGGEKIGGLAVVNGKLIGTDYVFYDAGGGAVDSHFTLSSLNLATATLGGMYQVGTQPAGLVAGYMAPIPSDWQGPLGAPYLTGQADIPIIARTSSGPAAFGFDPSQLGSSVAPATPYVWYDNANHPLGPYIGPANPLQSGNGLVNGVVFAPGTSSVLFFGSTGINYEGYGLPADWNDPYFDKGPHSLNGQYAMQVWAYNANDFVAVKQGTLQPWQVVPYDVWNFDVPITTGGKRIGGVAFDAATGRLYVSVMDADHGYAFHSLPLIEVYQLTLPSGPAQPAAPQIGTLVGTPASTDATGTPVTGAVAAGTSMDLTAGDVYAIDQGASVTQVKFYLDTDNDGVLQTSSDQLLGSGTPSSVANANHNWLLTISTTGLSSGNHTIFAQAQDSDGLLSDPIAMTLSIQ
jgi:hypothetical protein